MNNYMRVNMWSLIPCSGDIPDQAVSAYQMSSFMNVILQRSRK